MCARAAQLKRRRIVVAGACLLGGALISVLIAWSFALWSRVTALNVPLSFEQARAKFADEFGDGRYFDRSQQPGTRGDLLIITPPPAPESVGDEREAYWVQGSAIDFFGYRVAAAWDDLRGPIPMVTEFRAGWPLHCVRGVAATFPARNIDRSRGLIPVKGSLGPLTIQGERRLPLIPVCGGLIACSVLYGSMLWLIVAGPFELRRWRRVRRGLCVHCAYDLRGAAHERCPECGAAIRVRAASRAVKG